MIFIRTFLVLAIFGMANAGYLYYEHRKKNATLVCPFDHDCTVVTESKWSTVFGVRNELLGLIFFALAFGLALSPLALQIDPGLVKKLLILVSLSGAGFSVFLIGLQIWAIRDYCFYCVISAILTILLCVNSFYLNY